MTSHPAGETPRIAPFARGLAGVWLACAVFVATQAEAHGVWVAQRAGEWAVVLGDGPADDAYKADVVKSVQGRSASGAPLAVPVRAQARNVVLEPAADVAAVAVRFEDGYWSQSAEGPWVAGSRSKVPGATRAGYYEMYTHTVLAATDTPSRPFGLPLEIVPLSDPMKLEKGQVLKVRVLFDGKPLAGAALLADYVNDSAGPSVKTDAHGVAAVRLRSAGLNVIKVSHSRPRTDRSEADEDGFAATLAFTLPKRKE